MFSHGGGNGYGGGATLCFGERESRRPIGCPPGEHFLYGSVWRI